MNDIRYFLGRLLIILPLHGIEQFMTGFDELYELQGQVGAVIDLSGRGHGDPVRDRRWLAAARSGERVARGIAPRSAAK